MIKVLSNGNGEIVSLFWRFIVMMELKVFLVEMAGQ